MKSLIEEAFKRIGSYLTSTPLEYDGKLSATTGVEVYLKPENLQITGSFKVRGALNKILQQKDPNISIVTASSGNHGLGVAHALAVSNRKGEVYVPHLASPAKIEAIKKKGVPVSFYGNNCEETEQHVRSLAEEEGYLYVSPYNDIDVIAGQGTIGIELIDDLPTLDAVFISIGGGGLISGIASYLKEVKPGIKIIGCLPVNAPAMYECILADKIIHVEEKETLSDATAGGIEKDSITFPICQQLVDEYVLVSEEEIAVAMDMMYQQHQYRVEGAAGVAVAAFIKSSAPYKGKKVAIVLCGESKTLQTLDEQDSIS